MNPRFYFATCQAGAEKALKAEILSQHPSLRFAFSRPGFVTFKDESPKGEELSLTTPIFTRLWGEVISQVRNPEDPKTALGDLLSAVPKGAVLQCFDRDRFIPGEEPQGFTHDMEIRRILQEYGIALEEEQGQEGAKPGTERIYSLIWIDDFHLFLGAHRVAPSVQLPRPGNLPSLGLNPLSLPDHAPSRAWLKLEEAILRFKPVVQAGWSALEIGCAPGGASTALLDRGFTVTGIDPQFMDSRVASNPRFTHIRKPARFATPEDLASCNPDWIVMDMSISPDEALAELGHVMRVLRELRGKELKIRRGIFTIKLNDWKYAERIPDYLAKLGKLGFRDLRAVQLAENRQEFCAYAPKFAP